MTRKEAINILEHLTPPKHYDENDAYYIGQALSMAIEALEQEPCDVAVSRRAAIDIIESWLSCDDYNEAERHIMRAMQSVLYDLPPVRPQEPTDTWSIKDISDTFKKHGLIREQEPKKGEWIYKLEDWNECTCSECGYSKRTDVHIRLGWNYCPNCGAKMVEPRESEDKG